MPSLEPPAGGRPSDALPSLFDIWRMRAAGDGYPPADPRVERVGTWMAVAAVVWMLLVAAWGIAGPFPDGHFSATANIGTAAWNMLLLHLRYPVLWTPAHAGPLDYYLHHPLGVFWTAELFIKLFGVHDWVLRLPAVICSALSPFFVHRIGRAVWGPIEGGLAAVAYASLPITLGFANFHALEGPVILGCLVAIWGYVRYLQTVRERYALASLFGYFWALNHDWPAYVWGASFGFALFVRTFVVPERFAGNVHYRSVGRYWALLVTATIVGLGSMAYFIVDSGKLQDLYGAYANRSAGHQIPLRHVLDARHVWIELMFPGLAIALGKVALVVILLRTVLRRSWNELVVPLPLLLMAAVQYVYFKQGADVHIFWPHYFAPYFALSVGSLAAGVRAAATVLGPRLVVWMENRRVADRTVRRVSAGLPWSGLIVLAIPLALIWRDGASIVRLARETGGRFNSTAIQSDIDKAVAMRWYLQRYPTVLQFGFHPGMVAQWALAWETDNRVIVRGASVGTKAAHASRLYMLDTATTTVADLRQALESFKVTAVGTYWFLDRDAPPQLEGFSLEEREPTLWDWYWQGGTEPTRTVVPDPWIAWEWRNVLGVPGPPPPPLTGSVWDPNRLRIAHNAALTAGDAAGAGRLLGALRSRFNVPVTATWSNGTALLGAIHHRGAQRTLTLFFKAGTFTNRAKFSVTGRVTKRARLSTLALDDGAIEVAPFPAPSTDVWRAGHVYAIKIEYSKRPGVERYTGRFVTTDHVPAPTRVGATGEVDLLTVR